jgi:hypothetical protein
MTPPKVLIVRMIPKPACKASNAPEARETMTRPAELRFIQSFFLRKRNLATQSGPDCRTTQDTPTEAQGRRQAQRGRHSALPPRGGGARRQAPPSGRGGAGGGAQALARTDGRTVSAAFRAAVVGTGLVVRVARQANEMCQAGVGAPPPLTRGRRAVVRVRKVNRVVLEADRARRELWGGRTGKARELQARKNERLRCVKEYRVLVLGCKARGRQRDGAFNHSTGRGWVKGKAGQYADALQTLLGGGCHHRGVRRHLTRSTNHYRAFIRRLADRSKGANATDRTRYGRLRGSTRSFMRHHIQHVVKAAVVGDSEAILRQITFLKQRVFGTAQAAAGGSARDATA